MPDKSEIETVVESSTNKLIIRILWGGAGLLGVGALSFISFLGLEALENRQFRVLTGQRLGTLEARLQGLEQGITTPMAKETRTELASVWRAIDALKDGPK